MLSESTSATHASSQLQLPRQFRPITPDSAEAAPLRPPQFSRWKVLGPLEFSAMS